MAFPAQSPAPSTPVRPKQVTWAVWCLYALAATQILSVAVSLLTMGPTLDATREYVEGAKDGDAIVTATQIGGFIALGFGLIFAIGFAVLAVFVNRGSQPARIVSWVVLGLMFCCNGFGVFGAAAGGMVSGSGNTGDIDQQELARRVSDAVPGWVPPVNYVLLAIGIVASAAGIILLALPAANDFFRRPQQAWEPPVPGAYYPAPDAAGATGAGTPAAGVAAPAESAAPSTPAAPVVPAQPGGPVDVSKPSGETTPSSSAAGEAPAAPPVPEQRTETDPPVSESAATTAPGEPGSAAAPGSAGTPDGPDEAADRKPGAGNPPPAL